MGEPSTGTLRTALEALEPFAGCLTRDDNSPRDDDDWPPMRERIKDWFGWEDFRAAVVAVHMLRQALAAVPEASEPEYEWRVCVRQEDGVFVVREGIGTRDVVRRGAAEGDGQSMWVEARTPALAPGPWERVEEGTER